MENNKSGVTAGSILSREQILILLENERVPIKSWGTGKLRTLEDLCTYHHEDQFDFEINSRLGLIINVHVVVVQVIHKQEELYDDRQEFSSRHILRRKDFNGIAETMKRGESPIDGAKRCLKEELKFDDPSKYKMSEMLGIEHRGPVKSEKWAGLKASYHRHIFSCEISDDIYLPKGYTEIEGNRKLFFLWKKR